MAQTIANALQGREIADDYVRTNLPESRWSDTWALIKANFGKLVIINVLTLLFFIPGIALMVIRTGYISQMGLLYPLGSNAIGSYPVTPDMQGVAERLVLISDLMFFALLIVAGLVAAVGLSGGAYAVRKLINTRGGFTFKGYFFGVKACYFRTVLAMTVVLAFVFASVAVSDWAAYAIAMGTPAAGPVTAQVFVILATVVVGIICMWLFAVGVSYRLGFATLLKTSLKLCFKTILQTVLILAIALVPAWLLWLGFSVNLILIIAYIIYFLFGISFTLICWFAYTQWVLDLTVPPVVSAEKVNKTTPSAAVKTEEEDDESLARELLAFGKSELIGRPLRPLDGSSSISGVGRAYGRADIAAAAAARQTIEGEVREYYDAHKDEPVYAEYRKLFADREKALRTPEGRKGKKRVDSRNLLR